MKKILHLLIFLILTAHVLSAQTDITNMYPQNNYLINPASVGSNPFWELHTGYRRQWAGISNAPENAYLSAQGSISQSQGAGVFISHSSSSLMAYFDGKISYSYRISLSRGISLAAGASVGYSQQKFDISGVIATDYSDYLLTGNTNIRGVSSDIGFLLRSERLQIGFALPYLLHPSYSYGDNKNVDWFEYFIFHGSYNLIQNEMWLVQGIGLYKNNAQGMGADASMRVLWDQQVGLSAGYRTNNGTFLKGEFLIKNLSLAYSFEMGTNKYMRSHEVMLGIRFGQKKHSARIADQNTAPSETLESDDSEEVVATEKEEEVSIMDTVTDEEMNDDTLSTQSTAEAVVDSINTAFENPEMLIVFELNSGENVRSGNQEKVIREAVALYQLHPEYHITVIGHSCSLGSEEINQHISELRAQKVATELEKNGIPATHLTVIGQGESIPISKGTTPEELSKNRRVQLMFDIQ